MSVKRAAVILLLAVCIGALVSSLGSVPEIFEYNILSPKAVKAGPSDDHESIVESGASPEEKRSELEEILTDLGKRMSELSGVMTAWGVVAYAPETPLAGEGTGSALLKGLWGAKLHPDSVLTEGRQLYLEEIEQGAVAAVIDERLAIELYRTGDSIGRSLTIGEEEFKVVGVTRNSRTTGDREASSVLVPLKAIDRAGIQTRMLSVVMMPRAGAGAYAALSKAMADWHSGGDFYSLSKEVYRARLPLRLMLCAFGAMAVTVSLKLTYRASQSIIRGGKKRLESRYAARMLPELSLRALAIFTMYAANAAAIALILQALLAPVYIFPEWVPANPVDPVKILDTFWHLRESETGLLSMRSPELLRLSFLRRLMSICCAGLFFLLLRPFYLWKKRVFEEN